MTARIEETPWAVASGLGLLAALLGALAGVNPLAAIGISLGLALVVLVFADLTAGLIAFTLVAFLEYSVAGGPVLSLTKAAGIVLVAAWIARVTTSREDDTFFSAHPFASYLLLALLGWGALSLTWSADPDQTLVALTRYLLVMILFIIVYSAVRRRDQAAWLFGAFLLGAAMTAGYGLISQPSADAAVVTRLESTAGNANVLAAVLIAGLTLALGAAAAVRRSPPLRAAAIGVAVLCLISFVYTGSRSGVIGLAVVLVVSVVIAGRWRPQVLVGAIAVAVGTVLVFAAFAPVEIRERISESTPGESHAEEPRFTLWEIGWRMVEDEPLRGVGLGAFQASSVDYLLEPGGLTRTDQVVDEPKVVHNVYLQALAETGIVGALLWLAVLGFPIGCAVIAARNFERIGDREMEIMSRALVVALAGILATDFFASEQWNKLLWLLLGLGPAMLAISNARARAGAHRRSAA